MNGLRKKSSVFELFLIFCLLMGTIVAVSNGLDDAGMQSATSCLLRDEPSGNDSIGDIALDNASIGSSSGPATEFPESPVEVKDKNIDSMLKLYSPLVIDCWEIGCKPCKAIDPTIDEMAADFKGRIVFGKLCIDRNADTKNKYGITRTPTLLIFKDGTLVYKHVGNYPKPKLEEIILTALKMR